MNIGFIFLNSIAYLLLTVPFILIFMEKNKINYYRVIIFSFCFIGFFFLLVLGSSLHIIKGSWNWDGKILSIIWGVVCFLLFKKYFIENNFLTIKQNMKNNKKVIIVSMIFLVIVFGLSLFSEKEEFNIEKLMFQLLMPGIDEEILFRGVMLGLLLSCIKKELFLIKNPSLMIMSLLFGIIHGFTISEGFSIQLEPVGIIFTGICGYIYGWVTLQMRSVLVPILLHNLVNFFITLIPMLK